MEARLRSARHAEPGTRAGAQLPRRLPRHRHPRAPRCPSLLPLTQSERPNGRSLKRVSLQGEPNELVEKAEAKDESCLRSKSGIAPTPHPRWVWPANPRSSCWIRDDMIGPIHITLRGTDSLSDVDRGTALAVAPQVATGRTGSTSCSVLELRRGGRLAPSPEARRMPSATGCCVWKRYTETHSPKLS